MHVCIRVCLRIYVNVAVFVVIYGSGRIKLPSHCAHKKMQAKKEKKEKYQVTSERTPKAHTHAHMYKHTYINRFQCIHLHRTKAQVSNGKAKQGKARQGNAMRGEAR
ncbi:unnamed protein product [Ceratitis capitata]|uniref:(Mediterranean fruit fly) hypothetical protein n=1 Tax=Ceratitis capitata TaxID=7213 RepID=A0A811UUR8_CERCA|nr:unnamed protein product [Ceratitis capitata]